MGRKQIIVAYDGSGDSEKALQLAADLAKAWPAELHLVSVADLSYLIYADPLSMNAAQAAFKSDWADIAAAGKAAAEKLGVQAAGILLDGNPSEKIMEYAHAKQACLIVVGTRGLGGFQRLLLGSTALALVTYSDIPVLVAK